MINIKNLKFKYKEGESHVLKGIDLKVEKGEFLVIIGHNGSGKSTLAKLMNGILIPDEGEILINGMDTKDQEEIWNIRSTAGMVFQNPDNQLVATVVEEDVAFGPENLGIPAEEIRRRVDQSLDIVGMREFSKKPPHLLSGGQKQRVAIAGVLAMHPKCIILDEPTAMLDPSGRKEVVRTVEKLSKEENITIIHITHFMEEAIRADRVIVMDAGEIVLQGKPEKVFTEIDKLKEIGLDVPYVTVLAKELKDSGLEISQEILSVEEMVNQLCQL
ncbi:MAG: energy-coupling factor transporter ATPase [Firmicutes bacterium]|jgi:energy-coupling factor transport system ATP-binding protein|nr:energy-coupling factor transporter ATPase [Bacillota bacterium]